MYAATHVDLVPHYDLYSKMANKFLIHNKWGLSHAALPHQNCDRLTVIFFNQYMIVLSYEGLGCMLVDTVIFL